VLILAVEDRYREPLELWMEILREGPGVARVYAYYPLRQRAESGGG
jgi:hypothetical protein